MTNVRKQKSGDQLAVGDWLAPGALMERPAEVLFAYLFPPDADAIASGLAASPEASEPHVQLVVREQGRVGVWPDLVSGATLFDLASDEDLAKLREAAERAKFVAGLREFAAWVETNQWAPIKRNSGYVGDARVQIDLHADGDAGVADVALVREVADRLGVKVDESLDDRTDASIKIGSVSYSVIAWHKDGRPAEPAPAAAEFLVPAPAAAHYDTTDPDAGKESCACGDVFERREQLQQHIADPAGAVGGEPKCTPACDALQADPAKATGLDRSWHSDDCPVPVMHLVIDGEHATVCGIAHADRPEAHGRTPDHEAVTCKACLDRMPF